jgi:Xaa-Pro aminopeptidase
VIFDLMAKSEIDAMILGREANARAVAGTTRLWLAGTRPFSPGCVLVRETQAVHVLANTDDAVPEGFPRDRLFPITWNPEKLRAALASIPGLGGARRVAVDGMTPMMALLLQDVMPEATLTDATPLLVECWSNPGPERVEGVRRACEVAQAGLEAIASALRAGARPRVLRGAAARAFASFGVTTPAFEAVVAPLDGANSTWIPPERVLAAGELVVVRVGALRDGYEGSVARTYRVDTHDAHEEPAPGAWDGLLHAVVHGTSAGELRSRGAIVYGVGFGVEPWDDEFELRPGQTCALEWCTPADVRQGVIAVTDAGGMPLS